MARAVSFYQVPIDVKTKVLPIGGMGELSKVCELSVGVISECVEEHMNKSSLSYLELLNNNIINFIRGLQDAKYSISNKDTIGKINEFIELLRGMDKVNYKIVGVYVL